RRSPEPSLPSTEGDRWWPERSRLVDHERSVLLTEAAEDLRKRALTLAREKDPRIGLEELERSRPELEKLALSGASRQLLRGTRRELVDLVADWFVKKLDDLAAGDRDGLEKLITMRNAVDPEVQTRTTGAEQRWAERTVQKALDEARPLLASAPDQAWARLQK